MIIFLDSPYTPRDWQPSAEYPLYLINWKEASHTHSRTQNNPWLLDLQPTNPLIGEEQVSGTNGTAAYVPTSYVICCFCRVFRML